MSGHVIKQKYEQGLGPESISLVLPHGKPVYDRGAWLYRVGKRQVRVVGEKTLGEVDGLQVITSRDHVVITVHCKDEFRRLKTTHAPIPREWERATIGRRDAPLGKTTKTVCRSVKRVSSTNSDGKALTQVSSICSFLQRPAAPTMPNCLPIFSRRPEKNPVFRRRTWRKTLTCPRSRLAGTKKTGGNPDPPAFRLAQHDGG
jgi:hypothetical protein